MINNNNNNKEKIMKIAFNNKQRKILKAMLLDNIWEAKGDWNVYGKQDIKEVVNILDKITDQESKTFASTSVTISDLDKGINLKESA
tara:strand:+ start:1128 stop:1388 length:261 start_codon:yes stop_codon:yes gene_type:complete